MEAYKSHQTHRSPAEEKTAEQEDMKKLGKIVEGAFESVAKLTRLPVQEVLHIIEEVDVAQLKQATQEAIKKIADSTDLDRANIIAIFMAKRDASIDDIVHRLREESHVHRARW
jgi:metal-dependent HD superfamily phosphatase/phosphodiesterase